MSVIVAVTKDSQTAIASDTLTYFGGQTIPTELSRGEKTLKVGKAFLGISGWGVYDTLLGDYLPTKPNVDLSSKGAVFRFFLELWKALREDYQFVDDQGDDKSPFAQLDSSFLVASQGGLFRVTSDMGVVPFEHYCAIGSGSAYAMGALHAAYATKKNARQLAQLGVEAGIAFDDACGGPIDIHSFTLRS